MGSLGQRFQQITTKGVNKMDRRNFLAGAAVAAGAAALTGMTGCATNNDLPSTGDVDLKALAKEIDRLASIEEIRAQLFNYIRQSTSVGMRACSSSRRGRVVQSRCQT